MVNTENRAKTALGIPLRWADLIIDATFSDEKSGKAVLNAHSVVPIQLGPTGPQVPLEIIENDRCQCRRERRVWPVAPTSGIGTTSPNAQLAVGNFAGTAVSPNFTVASSTALGTALGSSLTLGSFGANVGSSDNVALGMKLLRSQAGSGWGTTSIGIGYDVDNTLNGGGAIWMNNVGNVGIGTTNPTGILQTRAATDKNLVYTSNSNVTGAIRMASVNDANSGYVPLEIDTSLLSIGGGNVGIGTTNPTHTLEVAGNAANTAGGSWLTISDIRMKTIEGDYEYGLDEIRKLHTVRFKYKEGNALNLPTDLEHTGFIAQEVRDVIPDAVVLRPDGYLELNVDPIHWATVNAVQELAAENDRIKAESLKKDAEIARLKSRLDAAESSTAELRDAFCARFGDARICR